MLHSRSKNAFRADVAPGRRLDEENEMNDQAPRGPRTPVLLLGLTLAVIAASAIGQEAATEVWTVEDCAVCHESEVTTLSRTPHRLLDAEDAELRGLASHAGDLSCSACHGDVTAHMEAGGGGPIFSFGGDAAARTESEVCATCHAGTHPRFFATAHAQAGVSCVGCHEIHDPAPYVATMLPRETVRDQPFDNLGPASQVCQECHGEVFTEFEWNERHRLQEGVLDCTSCHDPHEPQSRLALGGFKQQEQCGSCHTDKTGPFVFEHGSLIVEGCISCHTPHGSVNRHMLKFQSVADLCYSCHATVPGFHTRFTSETVCTNCHSSIHGSNFDPAFLK